MKQYNELNQIYETLHNEKKQILEYLEENDYFYTVAYYPFHSFKKDDEFFLEQYPIPVISISNKVDLGIDLNQIFFEIRFTKDVAISFDFHLFDMYQFEVYGIEDYYNDYYFDDIDQINNNILHSDEEEVGVSILISKDNILEDTINVLELLDNL